MPFYQRCPQREGVGNTSDFHIVDMSSKLSAGQGVCLEEVTYLLDVFFECILFFQTVCHSVY